MNPAIQGLWPALLTPLQTDGQIDTARAVAHAQRMLAAGCDGVTLFGTTGEGPAFTVGERQALLESMLGAGIRADQLVVTTTALALPDVVTLGCHALRLGVVRQMLMPPFYFNQPGDAGVVNAYTQVIHGISDDRLRLLLYHFPAMSTYAFSHAAIATLVARFPAQVVGIKDSSGDLEHSLGLVRAFAGLSVLVGAEPHIAPVLVAGGAGSINGLGNIAPHLLRRVMDQPHAVSADDHALMHGLLALLNCRPGLPFIGVYKALLAEQLGDATWCALRAPLSALTDENEQAVRHGYRALGAALAHV